MQVLENYLIVAMKSTKKKKLFSQNTYINYGLAAGILFKLIALERVVIEDKKLILKSAALTGDAVLDRALQRIIDKKDKVKKVSYWVTDFSRQFNKFKWVLFEAMKQKNIVSIEAKKFLGLFPYKNVYLKSLDTRSDLKRHYQNILQNKESLTEDDVIALAMLKASRSYSVFSKSIKDHKKIKQQLSARLESTEISEATEKIIKEMETAMVVIMASSTATTVISSTNS
ncbi:MAG: GOLPH3/VPS74 family protein [Bacteroidota bacterium]